MKCRSLIILIFFVLNIHAVELTKINPINQTDGSTIYEMTFEGRMIAPPHFIPFENSVALKWPDAINAITELSDDVELRKSESDLILIFKNNKIQTADLPILSLKLSGNTVKTNLPNPLVKSRKILVENSIKNIPIVNEPVKEKKVIEVVKVFEKKNEDYLSYLLSSVDKDSQDTSKNMIKKATAENVKTTIAQDKTLNTKNSANVIDKTLTSNDSKNFSAYMLRIFLVLSFIVGVILLLAKISKKIMVGKNKLGFLNNSKVVEILNTTYIAPKRQLILVKVHDQVMLIANSELGISYLSEIKDLSNILKNAEAEVSGSNFDTSFEGKTTALGEVVLKDHTRLFESSPVVESKSSKMRSVLKNKAKSLKAWQ